MNLPGTVVHGRRPQPVCAREDRRPSTPPPRRRAEGVVAVFTGADLRDDWKAAMPCAWPVTEDMKSPEHFPLAVERGALPGRRRRGRDRRHARACRRRGRARRCRRTSRSRRSSTSRPRRRMARHSCTRSWARTSRTSGSSRPATFDDGADVIVKHRYVQPPLIPNAIEPRGVVARPSRAATSRSGRRPRSRTSCACSPPRRSACPRRSCA